MRADRASTTAKLIAAATVFLARDPRVADLVPPGAAEICARFVSVEALSSRWLRWAVRFAERATIPGLMLHFMLRKRFIEENVRASLAAGCEQVVVVGADQLHVRALRPGGDGGRRLSAQRGRDRGAGALSGAFVVLTLP